MAEQQIIEFVKKRFGGNLIICHEDEPSKSW